MPAERKPRKQSPESVAAGTPFLTLKLRGPGVTGGGIPVPDLIKICQALQTAIKRQAKALENRKTPHPGPASEGIAVDCTLELMAVKKGSTTLEFGLTTPQLPLALQDFGNFGFEVVDELAASIRSLGNGHKKEIDVGVLQGLYSLASLTDSHRISEIEWISRCRGDQARISTSINEMVRERITSLLAAPQRAASARDGVRELPRQALGKGDFFARSSIYELASVQGVGPVTDASRLSGGFPPDEDIDEFLREIYEARR